MIKYIWLLVLAIPPWLAVQFDAPEWAMVLAVVPFFWCASGLGDADEDLLGDASGSFRNNVLLIVAAGGLVLIGVIHILWQVFFTSN